MGITLTVDGRQVTVPPGTLIVEAARQIGIEIPVFCYHPKMKPVGMCRMCLVTVGTPAINRETGQPEITEGGQPVIRWQPKPVTACTEPVSQGMVVITDSAQVAADRKAILEFLLTSHPLDCPVCDKGGECPLQDLTFRHGPGVSRFDYAGKHHGAKQYPLGDLIVLDQERCILCARCTRFQDEIAGDPVLAIENRGRDAMIVSYSNPVFDSHYSGNTTDICPVGALTTRDFRFRARPWELEPVASLCNHCGVGCNTVLDTWRGRIARIMPRQHELVNEVWLCDKGRFGHHFHASPPPCGSPLFPQGGDNRGLPQRLTAPMVRKDGRLTETSWEEALQFVADRLKVIRAHHGARAIGGIAGARLPNEDLYLFQKLLRQVIGSPNVDHRVGLSAAIEDDLAREVGVGSGTDLGRVGRDTAILVLGNDLDQEAPILYLRVAAAARRGATVINAGGRATKLDRCATQVLRYRYGAAVHLLLGMLHVILKESGAGSQESGVGGQESGVGSRESGVRSRELGVRSRESGVGLPGQAEACTPVPVPISIPGAPGRVTGLDALQAQVAAWSPERVAEVTGVPAEAIRAAAHAFASAKNGIILYGAEAGNDMALRCAIANLVIVTGFVGRPNNGVIAVLPHANSRGAADLGILPDRLPGYVPAPSDKVGMSAREMLSGGVRALLVVAADPLAGAMRPAALDLLVVQELFMTATVLQADVVLPACAPGERDGTFTNLERRVQPFTPALPPPGGARPDWSIVRHLAALLGADWDYASAGSVLAEMAHTVPLYSEMGDERLSQPIPLSRHMSHTLYAGMSYQTIASEGLQWPTLAEDAAHVLALRWAEPPALPTPRVASLLPTPDSMILVAPRVLYDGGTLLSHSALLGGHIEQPGVAIGSEDAAALGVCEGDRVQVLVRARDALLPCRIRDGLPRGVIAIPRNLAGYPAEGLLGEGQTFAPASIKPVRGR